MDIVTVNFYLAGGLGMAYVIAGILVIFWTEDHTQGRIGFWCGESMSASIFILVLWPITAPAAALSFRLFGRHG